MTALDRSPPLVLIHLAAGVQGSAVVCAALARGFAMRALMRDRRRSNAFSHDRVDWVEADLDDAASLHVASAGATHAVLQVPTGPAETMAARARNAASACVAADLRSVVLKLASASRPAPCEEPSFLGNFQVEEALRRVGLAFASVRPTMYLDNLLKPSARGEIVRSGVFAPPIAATQRIAWTCVDDCARAAIALMERGAMGDYRIAGSQSLCGDELAACISEGLGRHVAYREQSIDAFEHEVDVAMGAGTGRQIASKFRYFASHPEESDVILAKPFERQAGLEGFQPMDVKTWVRRHRHAIIDSAEEA